MPAILIFFYIQLVPFLIYSLIFLHRYASTQMYVLSKNWERIFYVLTSASRLDSIGHNTTTRLFFGALYITFYIIFEPGSWWFLLLPFHFLMWPLQGAIVNWRGHKCGYSSFNRGDRSKNTSPWGILLMGELFQNNHHAKNNANFACKWFKFDVTYIIMRGLRKQRITGFLSLHTV